MYLVLLAVLLLSALSQARPGAPMDVDIKDESIQAVTKFAVDQFAGNGGDANEELGELVSAKRQVVSGSKTFLKFKRPNGDECDVTVWDQPWNNKQEITESDCGHVLKKATDTKVADAAEDVGDDIVDEEIVDDGAEVVDGSGPPRRRPAARRPVTRTGSAPPAQPASASGPTTNQASPGTAAQSGAKAAENAAQNAAKSTGDAAQGAVKATEDAAKTAGDAAKSAGDAAKKATENVAKPVAEAAETAAKSAKDAVDAAETAVKSAKSAVDAAETAVKAAEPAAKAASGQN